MITRKRRKERAFEFYNLFFSCHFLGLEGDVKSNDTGKDTGNKGNTGLIL